MLQPNQISAELTEPRASRIPLLAYVAATFGFYYGAWLLGREEGIGWWLELAGLIFITFFTFTALHELGHVLAGRAAKFRLAWFRSTVLCGWRSAGGWTWGALRRPTTGGEVMMVPRDLTSVRTREGLPAFRLRLLAFLAGGLLATVAATALAAGLLWFLTPERLSSAMPSPFPSYVRGLLGAFCGFGVVALVLGLFRFAGIGEAESDEGELRRLLRAGPEGERELEKHLCGQLLFSGERPREWFPSWLRRSLLDHVLSSPLPVEESGILLHAYYSALDEGAVDEAAEILNGFRRAVEGAPKSSRQPEFALTGLIESAFLRAFHGEDPAGAREDLESAYAWHAELHADPERELSLLRAEAAVSLAEGRMDRAAAKASQALALFGSLAAVPQLPEPTGWTARRVYLACQVAEREWLECIIRSASTPASRPFAEAG